MSRGPAVRFIAYLAAASYAAAGGILLLLLLGALIVGGPLAVERLLSYAGWAIVIMMVIVYPVIARRLR